MRKTIFLLMMVAINSYCIAQCGNFLWGTKSPAVLKGFPAIYERNMDKNENIKIGNSLYLVSENKGGNPQMNTDFLLELFIDKINYQTMETESRKGFCITDAAELREATGIEREKEYFQGSYVFSDRIIVLTSVRQKKVKEVYYLARIINPELQVEKYVVYDTVGGGNFRELVPWGDGFIVGCYKWTDVIRNKATEYSFMFYDKEMNRLADVVTFPLSVTESISGLKKIIPMVDKSLVIVETNVKGGTALVLFDLKNKTMEFFNIDIKERVSDFKYKFNKDGDLVCAGLYLVDGGAKNLPDIKGIYLSVFKKGTVETKFACKIALNPETFNKYAPSSVNMTKTFLRYFKLIDICFDNDGNTVLGTERIDDSYMNNTYSKSEIVVYTVNSECRIINEHHIPKMLVSAYNATVSANMFAYKGNVHVIFRDNPQNLDIYDMSEVKKLENKNNGMLVITMLEESGKYVKKCLVPAEENIKDEVLYFPNLMNNSDDLFFTRGYFSIGKYLIEKE
jgi:hypothetical protein